MGNFSVPLILNPMTKEEKIEMARQSGLIGKKHDHDFAGAKYGQEIVCRNCGSRNIIVGMPIQQDLEKGIEIPYTCRDCGYEGTKVARVKAINPDGTLVADLVPDGLIGITGSLVGGDY